MFGCCWPFLCPSPFFFLVLLLLLVAQQPDFEQPVMLRRDSVAIAVMVCFSAVLATSLATPLPRLNIDNDAITVAGEREVERSRERGRERERGVDR